MLSSTLQSMLDNRLRYLPEITGKAIASIDWPGRIIEIGRKYGLHMDDIEELQEAKEDAVPVPSPELTIPSAPVLSTPKPQVPGSFDAFFVKTPTTTDHSMVK